MRRFSKGRGDYGPWLAYTVRQGSIFSVVAVKI